MLRWSFMISPGWLWPMPALLFGAISGTVAAAAAAADLRWDSMTPVSLRPETEYSAHLVHRSNQRGLISLYAASAFPAESSVPDDAWFLKEEIVEHGIWTGRFDAPAEDEFRVQAAWYDFHRSDWFLDRVFVTEIGDRIVCWTNRGDLRLILAPVERGDADLPDAPTISKIVRRHVTRFTAEDGLPHRVVSCVTQTICGPGPGSVWRASTVSGSVCSTTSIRRVCRTTRSRIFTGTILSVSGSQRRAAWRSCAVFDVFRFKADYLTVPRFTVSARVRTVRRCCSPIWVIRVGVRYASRWIRCTFPERT